MQKDSKSVIYWLLTGCFLIFIMVIVGGITRLTHSGLSMADYNLISGTLPPLNEADWQVKFDLYKTTPEFQKINSSYTLDDFKQIFFWEWFHRVIGRFIGIVFIIPFVWFLIKRKLTSSTIKKCLVLVCMGGFQGFLGWFMVKSGLVDRPDVSHYRLAMHLSMAFLTFAVTLWYALDLIYKNTEKNETSTGFKKLLKVTAVVLFIQIIWGAFVAGLDAGWIHNHWPMMSDGQWMHDSVTIEIEPMWRNFVEGKSGVQFVHRYLAYAVVALIIAIAVRGRAFLVTLSRKRAINTLLILVGLQFLLGIFTLILRVPVWLGVAHQVGAFFLLAGMTYTIHRFTKG